MELPEDSCLYNVRVYQLEHDLASSKRALTWHPASGLQPGQEPKQSAGRCLYRCSRKRVHSLEQEAAVSHSGASGADMEPARLSSRA